MDRKPVGAARGAAEGGFWGAAAVVASQLAVSHFPGVDGVGLMAAAFVGGAGVWIASVSRNVAHASGSPVVKAILGVKE